MRSVIFLIALAIFLATAAFVLRELIYSRVFGPADQGPSLLETLQRPATPNSFLMAEAASTEAATDASALLLNAPPDAIINAATEALDGLAETRRVDDDSQKGYRRFVVRTPIMRFPDTVELWVRPAPGKPGVTALSAYSRSQIGHSDLGANKARIEALSETLRKRFPAP